LVWEIFGTITKIAKKIWGFLLSKNELCINVDKNWVGPDIGDFFRIIIWSLCSTGFNIAKEFSDWQSRIYQQGDEMSFVKNSPEM
jgi:hypothetical protein